MGCDIHSLGQVKKNGKWISKIARVGGDDRDYDSFAVLANVRNGSGFAGVETGEGWPFMSEPKGLPSDLDINDEYVSVPTWYWCFDKEKKEPQDELWMGDHSHSYHTLAEIEEFVESKLPKTYRKTGIIDKQMFLDIQEGKLDTPTSWCGGLYSKTAKIVSVEDVHKSDDYTHVKYYWEQSTMDCLYFLDKAITAMRELAKEEGVSHDEIRLVFGFDS